MIHYNFCGIFSTLFLVYMLSILPKHSNSYIYNILPLKKNIMSCYLRLIAEDKASSEANINDKPVQIKENSLSTVAYPKFRW